MEIKLPSVRILASPCQDLAPGDDVVGRTPGGSGPFPNGTEVVYSCPSGYDFNGDTTAVCQFGNWSLDTVPYCTGKSYSLDSFCFNIVQVKVIHLTVFGLIL